MDIYETIASVRSKYIRDQAEDNPLAIDLAALGALSLVVLALGLLAGPPAEQNVQTVGSNEPPRVIYAQADPSLPSFDSFPLRPALDQPVDEEPVASDVTPSEQKHSVVNEPKQRCRWRHRRWRCS